MEPSLPFAMQGHTFRLSRQAAQLSYIPQGHKFRLSRRAAQLSYIKKQHHPQRPLTPLILFSQLFLDRQTPLALPFKNNQEKPASQYRLLFKWQRTPSSP
jgi:hypothetical protein